MHFILAGFVTQSYLHAVTQRVHDGDIFTDFIVFRLDFVVEQQTFINVKNADIVRFDITDIEQIADPVGVKTDFVAVFEFRYALE